MPVALDAEDTIAAVAAPGGPALRSIVRLSGPVAVEIAREGFIADRDPAPGVRSAVAYSGSLRVDGLRPPLPVMLALWPAPRTYTRQNMAEIHLVGSAPVVSLVLAHCLSRGARLAEPGEFTLRAFLSGRIDLTQAEAVLGVIDARNAAQLEAALEQLAGGLSGPIRVLRDRLLDVVADLEANLDFTEERDVAPVARAALGAELNRSAAELAALCQRLIDRDRPGGHPRVVLVGPPNVGKSRLFNALLEKERAIVSARAGTTRDYLSALLDCSGLVVELVDTAGIEAPGDAIAAQAQAFRTTQAQRADLLLECASAETACTREPGRAGARARLRVWTKADHAAPDPGTCGAAGQIVTSAVTGAGLDALRSAIAHAIRHGEDASSLPAGTAARCRGSIQNAQAALESAADTLFQGGGDELVSFDLRLAIEELGKVVGAVVTDDILDRIFRRFCIGK
jgi:tRNA modification GTPase